MGLEILNRFLQEEERSLSATNRLESLHPSYAAPLAPKKRHRHGKPLTPEPTYSQRSTLIRMHSERRTQIAIADALNVPRSQVRCWYKRMGLPVLSRAEAFLIGKADSRARAAAP